MVEPGSALRPDTLVEVSVDQLYGDFRKPSAPAAVIALRVVCLDAPNGSASRILLDKAYSERVPLRSRTAAGVVAGLSQGLKKAMSDLAPSLRDLPH